MDANNINRGRGNRRKTLSVAVAAAFSAGAGAANADQATATVEHTCDFPLIGEYAISSDITADLPAQSEVGEPTGPLDIEAVTTIPNEARQGLALAQVDTVEGIAFADSDIALENEENRLVTAELNIPQTNLPEEDGPFQVTASGVVESQTFNEEGDGEIFVGDLTLDMTNRDSSGNPVGDPIGNFVVDCPLITEDSKLHEFEVVGDDPVPDPAEILVEPGSIDFGNTTPGDPLENRQEVLTVSNEGDLDLNISNVTVEGNSSFHADSECTSLEGGESCPITVTYDPDTSLDEESATVVINSTDEVNPQVEVPVQGAPIDVPVPEITVTPDEVDFGTLTETEGNASAEVVVGNEGGASLQISDISVSGDSEFMVEGTDCGTSVGSGESCTTDLLFTNPGSAGSFSGNLDIANDDEDQQVPLTAQVEEETAGPGVEVDYDAVGSSFIAAAEDTIDITGTISSEVDLGSGDVVADLDLERTSGSFQLTTLFRKLRGEVDIEFEPVGETTGELVDGELTTVSELNIHIPKAKVNAWGLRLKIGGGTECRTEEPAEIELQSQNEVFMPLDGGTVAGTYAMPPLENCGLLTGVLNEFVEGEGNTIELELTPQSEE